jgi:hypothetical protein
MGVQSLSTEPILVIPVSTEGVARVNFCLRLRMKSLGMQL